MPRRRPFRRSLRPGGPVPIRCTNSYPTESVGRCDCLLWCGWCRRSRGQVADPSFGNASAAGDCRARAALTLRSPPAASKSLTPIRLLLAHGRHRLRLRCPGGFSSVIRRGNAKAHLLHTQCICACLVGPRLLGPGSGASPERPDQLQLPAWVGSQSGLPSQRRSTSAVTLIHPTGTRSSRPRHRTSGSVSGQIQRDRSYPDETDG